jgi:hypothetical protein
MKLKIRTGMWGTMLGVLLVLCLVGTVSAYPTDSIIGGIQLTTVKTDTITGDLWFDVTPAPNWGSKDVTKTFTLPETAVGNITWARLFISAYCGHMQDPKTFCIINKFDGNGDNTYETTWAEPATSTPYETLPVSFEYYDFGYGGNNNGAFAGHGTGEPYKMVNDHMNRVTSDYFMWYDVTSDITDETVHVNVNTTGSYDGRIKVISLVVAYTDTESEYETTYFVNVGHDVCSYYPEDYGEVVVGDTTFGTTGLTNVTSAILTVDYMASNNGYYGFPTADNDFEYTGGSPPVSGSFTDDALDRVADVQGAYSGVDSWNVTADVDGTGDVTLGYARYFPGTGTSAFFKIPLAILEVKSPIS